MPRKAKPVRIFVVRDRTGIFHSEMYFSEKEARHVCAELKKSDSRYAEGYVEALETAIEPSRTSTAMRNAMLELQLAAQTGAWDRLLDGTHLGAAIKGLREPKT